MYQYVCRYSDVIQFLLKRIKSTIFVTDMKMGMNKVPVCNRNGYGIELFCFFSISNSAHNRIEIFDSILIPNHAQTLLRLFFSTKKFVYRAKTQF
jgi:hypothetical protein